MNYSSVSSKSIIQRLTSRYGVTISKSDAIDWIGDAIEEIGYHVGFYNKIEKLKVVNYKIPIPCDFVSLNYFIYNGKKLKYGLPDNHTTTRDHSAEYDDVMGLLNANFKLELDDCCVDTNQEEKEYHIETYKKRIAYLESEFKHNPIDKDFYYTNSGQGYGTNATGYVYMFYKAFPLDDDGFPLIINEIKYRNAVMKYVLLCLLSNGYNHPVLDYPTVLRESELAISRAANEHFKMTNEQLEDFAGNWTNMLFRIKSTYNYYSNA